MNTFWAFWVGVVLLLIIHLDILNYWRHSFIHRGLTCILFKPEPMTANITCCFPILYFLVFLLASVSECTAWGLLHFLGIIFLVTYSFCISVMLFLFLYFNRKLFYFIYNRLEIYPFIFSIDLLVESTPWKIFTLVLNGGLSLVYE